MKTLLTILFLCTLLELASFEISHVSEDCYSSLRVLKNPSSDIQDIRGLDSLAVLQPELAEHLQSRQTDGLQSVGPSNVEDNAKRFHKVESTSYFVDQKNMYNWYAASAACFFLGGKLLNIRDDKQFEKLSKHLDTILVLSNQFARFWLDGNDLCEEDVYVSLDTGENITYAYWEANQPDNYSNEEDCMELRRKHERYVMNDIPCGHQKYIICERTLDGNEQIDATTDA